MQIPMFPIRYSEIVVLYAVYIIRLNFKSIVMKFDFSAISYFCQSFIIQPNLNSSNTDGSFIMANSNSFLSPYEILPIA